MSTNKATASTEGADGTTGTPTEGGDMDAKAVFSGPRHENPDIQRLRSLVNLLNMRIELLESELAQLRNKSDGNDN